MTISRIIPQGVNRELDLQESREALIVFLTFHHDNLHEPLRIVSDPENFILDGNEYQAFNFDLNLPSDNDGPPRAKLTIVNIDERIGRAILASTAPIRLDIEVVALSEFNLSEFPRTEKEVPSARVYKASHLRLIEVTGNVVQVTGTIASWDYTQESWPAPRATEDNFPALFWS